MLNKHQFEVPIKETWKTRTATGKVADTWTVKDCFCSAPSLKYARLMPTHCCDTTFLEMYSEPSSLPPQPAGAGPTELLDVFWTFDPILPNHGLYGLQRQAASKLG